MPNVLAIDFDGVIMRRQSGDNLEAADFIRAGYRREMPKRFALKAETIPGTAEALSKLADDWTLTLHTCRARHEWGAESGREYLRRRNLLNYFESITPIKPHAAAYIDDHAHRFTTWANVLETFSEAKQ